MLDFVFSYTVLMISVHTVEGLSLLANNTAFLEYLAIEDMIVCVIILDVHIAVLGESLKFIFCFHGLFITSTSLNEAKYVVRSMIDL